MFACPICGSANPPGQPSCSICGTIFRPPPQPGPPPAAPAGPPQQTVVGHAPPGPLQQTMVGYAPPGLAPGPAAGAPPQQTLLGFGPGNPVQPAQPDGPRAPAPAEPARPLGKTVVGLGAPPGLAAVAPAAALPPKHTALGIGPEPAAAAPPPGAAAPPEPAGVLPPAKRTILGVARPGIAPLNPGVAKPAPPPNVEIPAGAHVLGPGQPELLAREHATLPLPDDDQPAGVPKRARFGRIGWLLLGLGLLAASALLAWLVLRAGPTLQARLVMNEHGTEQLELECADCADGTTAALDGKTAHFVAYRATLPLARPLAIGDNRLTLSLTPPSGRARSVELDVPLQYRVRGDLKTLAEAEPKIRIWVEAEPGTQAAIDGVPVQLGADGKAQHSIDVTRELTGLASNVARLEKKLSYRLSPPGRQEVRGQLLVQIGVVPLVVEAPGEDVVTERSEFMLSGRSHRGASVSVSGRPITTDTSGGFAQLMSVSAPGETTIVLRADAPAMAPRLFPIRVKRVPSLAAEAQRLKAGALDSYRALERAEPNRPVRVALEGRLAEARIVNHRSVLLLEMDKGCTREPCLVRVLYGLAPPAKKGMSARVYGRLLGRVPGLTSGSTIPEVRADIVLLGK